MLVSEVVERKRKQGNKKVYALKENSSAFEAVEIMKNNRIGSLLIIGADEALIGILSEKDILYKCYATQAALKECLVKDIMTPVHKIVISTPEDTTEYLRNVMTSTRIRHIPVLNAHNEIEGVVSLGDLVKAELAEQEEEAKLLRKHIQNPFGIHLFGDTS